MTAPRIARGSGAVTFLAHVGALLTASAWGGSFIASKVLMADGGFTPVETYIYRFAAAYLLLLLVTFRKMRANNLRDELTLFVCGICAGSVYFILENYALENTTTGNVSLLASVSPLFTTLLVALVYKVRIGAGDIVGSLVAFAGVFCIIFSHGETFEINPKGDVLALSASLSWAVYTLLAKRVIPVYNSLFITRKLFFYGVITALPLLLLQREPLHLRLLFDFSAPQYFFSFLFLVAICSMFAYIVWNEAMKVLGSVMANNYMYVQPLVTMVLGYFILQEGITWLGYLGCFLIIGGLVVADKWKPKLK